MLSGYSYWRSIWKYVFNAFIKIVLKFSCYFLIVNAKIDWEKNLEFIMKNFVGNFDKNIFFGSSGSRVTSCVGWWHLPGPACSVRTVWTGPLSTTVIYCSHTSSQSSPSINVLYYRWQGTTLSCYILFVVI